MSNYKTNGFLVSLLEEAQGDSKHKDHAAAETYLTKFRALEDEFFENVHTQVDIGLAMNEVARAGASTPDVYTIHGCRHISDLIKSLDKLANEVSGRQGNHPITVLEAYILLSSAHVHDAANILKRESHPERCDKIIKKYRNLFVSGASQQIYDVARVHGGRHPDFGKDTFRSIAVDSSTPPRLLLLAAFLRLGDELSENEERVPQAVVNEHPISERSKLAHAYAKSFVSFELKNESLGIVYNVYPSEHNLHVEIDGVKTGFYDFLEDKINVIDRETRYCSQYARPSLHISEINITIRRYRGERPSQIASSETFSLQLNRGYPDLQLTLCQRSQELSEKQVQSLADCFHPSKSKKFNNQTQISNAKIGEQKGLVSNFFSKIGFAKYTNYRGK